MITGRLDKRVRVEAATTKRGPAGEAMPLWQTVATRWASIEPLGGQELERARAMESNASVRIRMRYLEGLTTRHRLVRGGGTTAVVYQILSVSVFREKRREVECLCTVIGGETP